MSIVFPEWPPAPYDTEKWADHWLRYETEYPGSGQASCLVSHSDAPYISETTDEPPEREALGAIASNYLKQLNAFLETRGKSLHLPQGWFDDLIDKESTEPQYVDLMHWLDVWPPVESRTAEQSPRIASWNLSRNERHALPATIIMVATEFLKAEGDIAQFTCGITVPMLVERTRKGFRVIIRSMSAEYPSDSQKSWSTVTAQAGLREDPETRQNALNALVGALTSYPSEIRSQIGEAASVLPKSISLEQFLVVSEVGDGFVSQPVVIETMSKARGSVPRFPNALSYLVVNRIEATPISQSEPPKYNLRLLGTETYSMITHVDPGHAKVLVQTPPGSNRPGNPKKPQADYDWTLRRPTRTDNVLDRFRETVKVADGDKLALKAPGFRVRRCPEFVPQDHTTFVSFDPTKIIHLPTDNEIQPRRNEFSALSAYYNARDFFEMLGAYGINPTEFVARAEPDIQIYYRYGIAPGPGKDGRTVNAQVAFDCKASKEEIDFGSEIDTDAEARPIIRMNLALAEMSRWDRPKDDKEERTWAQPLGIATDKRWMLHEFGHYLLAARIGQLEFNFAHSAGDAMAAIACDPDSRLADTRDGVAESFRGITYPFVFSTRRHDRSPTLGWAWYGELNRSVIEAPPTDCDTLKGYLTEQILSSTLFRLYRALGGDSMHADADADAPDIYLRQRASFLTLCLLIRAIHAFGQSPSKAEMLELGMEQVGRLQADVLKMVPALTFPGGMPQPDGWKGGLTHKVVRWAFETQGMFVSDREATHNGMGLAPDVDIYVKDQRPLCEMVNGNRFTYGPGSYCPVSLDWGDAALWQMSDQVVFGNRGAENAKQCKLRKWFGLVIDADENWGLTSRIFWVPDFKIQTDIPKIAPGERRDVPFDDVAAALAAAQTHAKAKAILNAPTFLLLELYELSCPDDRANTDPAQSLAVAVGQTVDNLPVTPRALTDLVANDNNLGLRAIRSP